MRNRIGEKQELIDGKGCVDQIQVLPAKNILYSGG